MTACFHTVTRIEAERFASWQHSKPSSPEVQSQISRRQPACNRKHDSDAFLHGQAFGSTCCLIKLDEISSTSMLASHMSMHSSFPHFAPNRGPERVGSARSMLPPWVSAGSM